jgi:hypothetical protein
MGGDRQATKQADRIENIQGTITQADRPKYRAALALQAGLVKIHYVINIWTHISKSSQPNWLKLHKGSI